MGVLGTLGAIPFICSDGMVNTFNKFSSSYGESYAEHKVIGGAPALEWTGSNTRSFSLDMRLDSSLGTVPSAVIKALQLLMKAHNPIPLLIGPAYYGTVVIESLDVEDDYWTGLGVAQVCEVSVKLKGVTDGLF